MKNFQNSFKVSGYVGFSEVKAFPNASVCRFSISVSKYDKETSERTTAFMSAESWKSNAESDQFQTLAKGNLVTLEGFFKPEEWTDKDGQKQSKIVLVATKFYPIEDK